ncbi:putative metal-dependent membrane protease [Halanaeroarchaeum sulfurireducens]|uniref:Putative metal-dependent membrane protease n=1 Tax=Halanaeroarchaeum sulfurireducens TaxID=1604004 RepID=A0A0F7PDR1_9EURY|nr:putative metal-dependent membrane protease [Halanaeroarchaeum sulfurireducens]ALG81869.1 putative metal-dependent membrane protease [Halanaeroarchaeum sulfurireducens]
MSKIPYVLIYPFVGRSTSAGEFHPYRLRVHVDGPGRTGLVGDGSVVDALITDRIRRLRPSYRCRCRRLGQRWQSPDVGVPDVQMADWSEMVGHRLPVTIVHSRHGSGAICGRRRSHRSHLLRIAVYLFLRDCMGHGPGGRARRPRLARVHAPRAAGKVQRFRLQYVHRHCLGGLASSVVHQPDDDSRRVATLPTAAMDRLDLRRSHPLDVDVQRYWWKCACRRRISRRHQWDGSVPSCGHPGTDAKGRPRPLAQPPFRGDRSDTPRDCGDQPPRRLWAQETREPGPTWERSCRAPLEAVTASVVY